MTIWRCGPVFPRLLAQSNSNVPQMLAEFKFSTKETSKSETTKQMAEYEFIQFEIIIISMVFIVIVVVI